MKQILTAVLLLSISFFMTTCATVKEEEPDYIMLMTEAAISGDTASGKLAETLRNQHIDELGLSDGKLKYDDLFLLSKFICSQSGSFKDNDDYRLCIGEVILNRVASPEFPGSIEEVIFQPGAFENVDSEEFANSLPTRDCVNLALRLLQGERLLAPHVVHWSKDPETDVYATFCDRRQNFTYFCESEYPRFYHLPNKKSD